MYKLPDSFWIETEYESPDNSKDLLLFHDNITVYTGVYWADTFFIVSADNEQYNDGIFDVDQVKTFLLNKSIKGWRKVSELQP